MADENEIKRIIRNALHKSAQTDPLPAEAKPPMFDIPAGRIRNARELSSSPLKLIGLGGIILQLSGNVG